VSLDAPVDPALIDRAAEAAYIAAMGTVKDEARHEPWVSLPEYFKRLYRVQAAAIISMIGGAS
jgi:hypothetical protein